MSPELIFVICVFGGIGLSILLICWIDGAFKRKTKWYKVNEPFIRKYKNVPGINACTKCGSDNCILYIDYNLPQIGIYKKEVVFDNYCWPRFYVECQKCGTRSLEDGDIKYVIDKWNMDSRFQLEDNK